MQFDCQIEGAEMVCAITTDVPLRDVEFCCSGMAPLDCVAGGRTIASLGSQIEVALPDLAAQTPHKLTLSYRGYSPANRAWLPLGPYLRHADGITPLPALPAGRHHPERTQTPDFDGLRLIPQPDVWKPVGTTAIANGFVCNNAAFAAVAALAQRNGLGSFLTDKGLPVTIQATDLPANAYHLTIAANDVVLTAGEGGQFYGAITLLTLLHTHQGALPCGTLTDAPRFGWRGQHLDCARHFFQPPTITQLLDLMALLKLNRFHWHFADDEAFRLQIDSLPDLWQRTEFRGEGELLPGLFGGGIRSGGSYTKSDAADLVAHAAALQIEVMPEIEVPAHALALARVYPDTQDPADTGTETSVQGYRANVLNPAMPETWRLLENIATEVGALFPFGHLHLGCDELPENTWMASPAARALMDREGLDTTQDLQGWTMAKLAATVTANGQHPAAWEEAAQGKNGGIGHNAILFSWSGQGPGIAAAKAGYDIVMTPAQHVYLDMAHTVDPADWGANWAAYVSLADTINWNPVPPELGDAADRIIGVQGAFWGEFTTRDDQLWPMLLPRILGVAVKAWQREVALSGDDLTALARHYAPIFGAFDAS